LRARRKQAPLRRNRQCRSETHDQAFPISFDERLSIDTPRQFAVVQRFSFALLFPLFNRGKLQSNADNKAWLEKKIESRKLLPVRKYELAIFRNCDAMAIIAQLGLTVKQGVDYARAAL
jgi:hypothetical protein